MNEDEDDYQCPPGKNSYTLHCRSWVSVNAKWPPLDGRVLTYDGTYIRTGEIMYFDEDGSVQFMDGSNGPFEITHWMPLPEPPL